jgi:hypothetical protein
MNAAGKQDNPFPETCSNLLKSRLMFGSCFKEHCLKSGLTSSPQALLPAGRNGMTLRLEVVMVTQQVTKDFIVRQIEKLSQDGLVEIAQFIEFLQFREQGPIQAAVPGTHSAFGVWADYPEAKDPAAFALKLRQNMERRQDD